MRLERLEAGRRVELTVMRIVFVGCAGWVRGGMLERSRVRCDAREDALERLGEAEGERPGDATGERLGEATGECCGDSIVEMKLLCSV